MKSVCGDSAIKPNSGKIHISFLVPFQIPIWYKNLQPNVRNKLTLLKYYSRILIFSYKTQRECISYIHLSRNYSRFWKNLSVFTFLQHSVSADRDRDRKIIIYPYRNMTIPPDRKNKASKTQISIDRQTRRMFPSFISHSIWLSLGGHYI